MNVDKLIDKNPSTKLIENHMLVYKNVISYLDDMPKERTCYFISVDFSNVISNFK